MIETIKRIIKQTIENLSLVELVEATIVSPPPNISIKLKNNNKLVIPKELILVAERLVSSHSHTGVPSHTNKLNTGDSVMVAVVQGGQSFFILDKIVSY